MITLVILSYICFMLILDDILKDRGMNVTDLYNRMKSRGVKLSRLSISRILNKESSPKLSTLEDIASALDINVVDMFLKPVEKSNPEELVKKIKEAADKLLDETKTK